MSIESGGSQPTEKAATMAENAPPLVGSAGGGGERVVVISSYSNSLVNFRLELLKRMAREGHRVYALGPEHDDYVIEKLREIGVTFIRIPMARAGLNPLQDVATFLAILRILRKVRAGVTLPYTMKPIIYGGLAARVAGVPERYALVTGLGYAFSPASRFSISSLVRALSIRLYKLALKGARRVFVYNDADYNDIVERNLVPDSSAVVKIPGSGVDLNHYRRTPPPKDGLVFLLIARLLRDKGVLDYVEAARLVRSRFPDARFQILGMFDPNPSAISPAEVDGWVKEGVIEFLGETRDVRPYLEACSVMVLPTYYREGIPRSILEALSTGRAVITTDMPGCRDTVRNGENGWLVPPRAPAKLAEAMETFAMKPDLVESMGAASHALARSKFDVHAVNNLILGEMRLIKPGGRDQDGRSSNE
jgi:glycosyltransferase involved in cell wall biosynthesis